MKHNNKINTHKPAILFKILPMCYFPTLFSCSSSEVTTILNFVCITP